MQCGGDFPHGASEPVYGHHHQVIAMTEPAHALRPTRSVAPGASGGGVGEDSVGCDARRRTGVVLLVDGLLSGGHPKVRGGAHWSYATLAVRQFIQCQTQGKSDSPCDTRKSDSATCADLMPAVRRARVPDV